MQFNSFRQWLRGVVVSSSWKNIFIITCTFEYWQTCVRWKKKNSALQIFKCVQKLKEARHLPPLIIYICEAVDQNRQNQLVLVTVYCLVHYIINLRDRKYMPG
ncbi:Hypothetical_protein [Hexamita inflata]|uniref:Hypothetical_protein n=1 Tax=Hexamita inflata TaxID=28002 RepID=A0AA86N9X5_9EUKA|nr:Hypothetical protein HINF_LOCUS3382 [Hexamita inflata]